MRLVVLAGGGQITNILVNFLRAEVGDENLLVIKEDAISGVQLFRRRMKTLGIKTALGHLAFIFLLSKPQRLFSKRRILEIMATGGLNPDSSYPYIRVATVNDLAVIERIDGFAPDLVVVNGTRIITRRVIRAISAPMINIHAGFTPNYRGVHGGYWARARGEDDRVGTTVHFIDPGIDTGAPIRRQTFSVTPKDNFSTYPYLHIQAGLAALRQELAQYKQTGRFSEAPASAESCLYYHPTLFGYLKMWLLRGVK